MSERVLHQSHTIPTDGVGARPSFTPEQIEEYQITPEELSASGQATPEEEAEGKILGKFESQEDLTAAYIELEKKFKLLMMSLQNYLAKKLANLATKRTQRAMSLKLILPQVTILEKVLALLLKLCKKMAK